MKLISTFSHHYGEEEWLKRDLHQWVCSICNRDNLNVTRTKDIHQHFRDELTNAGWSGPAKVSIDSNLSVFSLKADLAFQVQLGNISRCAYDLLKIQYLYQSGKINAAALVLPTNEASKKIGTSSANASRIWNEVQIFNRVITVPILILAIE
ncbi:BglII/BstYI family type II restriction endonuclease [Paenibacillus lautus]|uniref:BglII/BstYI family type II restriction endonuclease n=1 Tax=Paenibacillus lautus TaxID=1401 RepID=UPI000FD7BB1B|nr:BglII/BstYI family type II restriction endonuclease [Paenibacillus lautus]